MSNKYCPVCSEEVIYPIGDVDSNIILVFDKPTLSPHLKENLPWKSMFRFALKFSLLSCRLAFIEHRKKPGKKENELAPYEYCLEIAKEIIKQEAERYQVAIVFGAIGSRLFLDKPIDDVSGLVFEDCDLGIPTFFCKSPKAFYNDGIGEYKLMIDRLREYMKVNHIRLRKA